MVCSLLGFFFEESTWGVYLLYQMDARLYCSSYRDGPIPYHDRRHVVSSNLNERLMRRLPHLIHTRLHFCAQRC
jgi:hypothetical protein